MKAVVPGSLWRISNYADLAGLGGERYSARWHTAGPGKRIVYLAEHPALALLENLVHLKGNARLMPESYQLMEVSVPEDISLETVKVAELPGDWTEREAVSRGIGDAWLAGGETALLSVPAAPVPGAWNYLLNPRHRDAARLAILWAKRITYDSRLIYRV